MQGIGFTVLRELPTKCSNGDPMTNQRWVGHYKSNAEANFIARKAEKMEKAGVLAAKFRQSGKRFSPLNMKDVQIEASYIIVPGNHQYTAVETNGRSNILAFIEHSKTLNEERKNGSYSVEHLVADPEGGMTFRQWVIKTYGTKGMVLTEEDIEYVSS
jgi:hypothetical protein